MDNFYQSFSSLFTFRSSFKTVSVFAEKTVLWISAQFQISDKNRDRLETPLGIWTNPV